MIVDSFRTGRPALLLHFHGSALPIYAGSKRSEARWPTLVTAARHILRHGAVRPRAARRAAPTRCWSLRLCCSSLRLCRGPRRRGRRRRGWRGRHKTRETLQRGCGGCARRLLREVVAAGRARRELPRRASAAAAAAPAGREPARQRRAAPHGRVLLGHDAEHGARVREPPRPRARRAARRADRLPRLSAHVEHDGAAARVGLDGGRAGQPHRARAAAARRVGAR